MLTRRALLASVASLPAAGAVELRGFTFSGQGQPLLFAGERKYLDGVHLRFAGFRLYWVMNPAAVPDAMASAFADSAGRGVHVVIAALLQSRDQVSRL